MMKKASEIRRAILAHRPMDIEKKSMAIIRDELGARWQGCDEEALVKRVIHTTADFDYAETLVFSEQVIPFARELIRRGAVIVTDTRMAYSGINKAALAAWGADVRCYMQDEDIAAAAKERGLTRSYLCMEKAFREREEGRPLIFAIGNAPTALIALYDLYAEQGKKADLILAAPVGFVNVVEAKELILALNDIPSIVAIGRKGGSNVAAAMVNAISYSIEDKNRGL